MTEELDLSLGVTDQYFFMNNKQHTIEEYLDGVDGVLETIKSTGDFEIGVNFVRSASAASRAVGLSMAKLLHGMLQMWDRESSFYEYMQEFTSLSMLTIGRYINAWEGLQQVPLQLQEVYTTRPMKDLIALGSALSQGYTPTEEEWNKLSNTPNNPAFAKVLREDVKGAEPRSNSLTIYLEKSGDLVVWDAAGKHQLGYLNISECDTDASIKKAVERIVKSAGILIRD